MTPSSNKQVTNLTIRNGALKTAGVIVAILFVSSMLGFTYYNSNVTGGSSCAVCDDITSMQYFYTGYGFPFNFYTQNGYTTRSDDGFSFLPLRLNVLSPTDVLQKLENDSDINGNNSYSLVSLYYPSGDEHVEWQMLIYNLLTWLALYLATTRYIVPYIRGQRLRKKIEAAKTTN